MPKLAPINYDEIHDGLIDLGLKESTVRTYISKQRKVLKGVFGKDAVTKAVLKKNTKKIVEYISGEDYKNANTRKVALMAITHLFTLYELPIDYFERFVVDWSRLADAEAVTNTPAEVIENIKNIDFDEIQKSIATTDDPTDRLIKAFYCGWIPPLRQQDLINVKVVDSPSSAKNSPNRNVLILRSNRLLVREHKTDKIHGAKSVPLPFKLMKEVRKYLKDMDTMVLFPFSSSGFTRRMNRLFGCSTSTFRKAYVSKVAPTMTAEERARVAEIMGHRLSTSLISYNKDLKDGEQPISDTESESD